MKVEELIQKRLGVDAKIELLLENVTPRFVEALRSRANTVIEGVIEGIELMIAFIEDIPKDAELEETPVRDNLWMVPLESWWQEAQLPCEATLWLEKNKKAVRYVKSGRVMYFESYERLKNRGVSHLCIGAEDFGRFRAYRDIVRWINRDNEKATAEDLELPELELKAA